MITAILRILFLLPLLLLSLQVYPQAINLSQKISIDCNNKPLDEVLNEIEQKSNIHFSFSNEKVLASQRVSIRANNESVHFVMEEICKQLNLEFVVVEKQVILKPKKIDTDNPSPVNEATQAQQNNPKNKFTISGYITDLATNELLIGSTVYIKELNAGTATNTYGFYSITLPENEYTLEVSFLGYEKTSIKIQLNGDKRINTTLSPIFTQLKSVEIVQDEQFEELQTSQMGMENIKQQDIKKLPVFMGEADVIKSLQTMPGIKSYGDGSAYFYVRGGEKDQNLILIDEAPIYNPSHLFGFFTSFSSDAIKDIEVYKTDIPVSKESGLSSLIDIKTKDGNMNHFAMNGGISPIASRISIEGPLKKEKSSYFISSRRSNIEWFLLSQDRAAYDIYFYDFSTKLNFRFNDRSRLFVTFYSGKDYFGSINTDAGKSGISWGNNAITTRWNQLITEKTFSNTIIYASKYYYYFYVGKNNYWNETISNLSLKSDFTTYLTPKNTLRYGINLKGHYFDPGNIYLDEESKIYYDSLPQIPKSHARLVALYLSNEQKIGDRFSMRYGMRVSLWQNIGPTKYYLFDENHDVNDTIPITDRSIYNAYFNPEPRISLSYLVDSASSVKASYERTAQYLQLLSNTNSPFTSLDVWVPSGPNIKPQTADQLALGYYRTFKKLAVDVSIEAYYKYMYNQIDYEDHASLLLNPLLEGELRFGNAWSYGLEFLFSKTYGQFTGTIAYTLSKTERQINGINNNNPYSPYYDRPNDVSIMLNYQTKKRWTFSTCFYYATGSSVTTPTSYYYYYGAQVPIYAEKNNERLPDYHRLDISASFRLNKNTDKKFQHNLTFSIYNVYNRKNPFTATFNKIEDEDGRFVVAMNTLTEPGIVPTQIYLLGIVPSIHYNFSWR